MTEDGRSERERRYRGPLPGEVPLSRSSRAGGATPGVGSFAEAASAEAGPAPSSGPPGASGDSGAGPVHVPDRPPSRAERRVDDREMVPLLAQALAAQLARLATHDDPAPDGWWFTPDR